MKTASGSGLVRHTSDEAFGMSGPCFAEHLGNDNRRSRSGPARASAAMCSALYQRKNDRQNVLAWP